MFLKFASIEISETLLGEICTGVCFQRSPRGSTFTSNLVSTFLQMFSRFRKHSEQLSIRAALHFIQDDD